MGHSPRSLVERLDFVTTVGFGDGPGTRERLGLSGAGPSAVITDLGVLEPDPATCELTLTQLHPGVSVDDAREATGWELAVADDVRVTEPPDDTELAALRELLGAMSEAFIYEAVRTPFGRFGGALAGIRPDDLATHSLRALLERSGDPDPQWIDDVILGAANASGEDNRNVARMAVLLAGLPTSVPGATVNRLCGSSLEAAIQASRAIRCGDASLVIVGGVESMSRAPWVLLKPSRGYPAGNETLHSSTLGWRMVNPQMPEEWTISLGASAEKLAAIHGITRDAQDAFALRSHQLAARAYDDGVTARGRASARGRSDARRGHPHGHLAGEARRAETRRSSMTAR